MTVLPMSQPGRLPHGTDFPQTLVHPSLASASMASGAGGVGSGPLGEPPCGMPQAEPYKVCLGWWCWSSHESGMEPEEAVPSMLSSSWTPGPATGSPDPTLSMRRFSRELPHPMCPVSGASPFTSCPLSLFLSPQTASGQLSQLAACQHAVAITASLSGPMRWPRGAQDTVRCAVSEWLLQRPGHRGQVPVQTRRVAATSDLPWRR